MARTHARRAPLRAGGRGTQKTRRLEPKKKSSWLILVSTEKSESAAWHRCESKRGTSLESCAFQMRMLSHGLLQMGSRHAPACPQQSVGRHGRRSAPSQHFATAVPMGSRDAGRGSPPGTRRRVAPIQVDHPRGRGDEAGSPSRFASSKAAEAASDPPPSCKKRPTYFHMDDPPRISQCVKKKRTRKRTGFVKFVRCLA